MARQPTPHSTPPVRDKILNCLLADTTNDLRDVIAGLMERREEERDTELERLDQHATRLLRDLHDLDRQRLVEELKCFKDVLALHRRLRDHENQ